MCKCSTCKNVCILNCISQKLLCNTYLQYTCLGGAFKPVFSTETFQSFLAETFLSLKHFGHLSHSCHKTCHKSVFSLYFQTFWLKWLIFFAAISNTLRAVEAWPNLHRGKTYGIGTNWTFVDCSVSFHVGHKPFTQRLHALHHSSATPSCKCAFLCFACFSTLRAFARWASVTLLTSNTHIWTTGCLEFQLCVCERKVKPKAAESWQEFLVLFAPTPKE